MIIVTGANGFIGSNMVYELRRRGKADLLCVDVLPSIRGKRHPVRSAVEVDYDTPNPTTQWLGMGMLPDWLARHGAAVDAVVHLGALSDTTLTDRDRVWRHNLEYTRAMWNWATAAQRPLLYASSAATYGDGTQGYSDEADPRQFRPLNLYADSKHEFDLWALEQPAAPPRWAGLKYFNVYGPNESHKGHMASVAYHSFQQIRDTGRVRLFKSHREGIADGQQRRDFIFVQDAVDATLHFLETPASAEAPNGLYNVGTGEARTFEDVARAVFAALGRPAAIDYVPMPEHLRAKYQYFTQATVAKLVRAGFDRPMTTIENGIGQYVRDVLMKRAA
ncbi:MAG: ADP-glyceromanno-heptose 6-epimerase [Planctomycetia bacterium]|nr:ADP-glyceromanno-heptose 6-epimerase [Planctomycetia bacterium]